MFQRSVHIQCILQCERRKQFLLHLIILTKNTTKLTIGNSILRCNKALEELNSVNIASQQYKQIRLFANCLDC